MNGQRLIIGALVGALAIFIYLRLRGSSETPTIMPAREPAPQAKLSPKAAQPMLVAPTTRPTNQQARLKRMRKAYVDRLDLGIKTRRLTSNQISVVLKPIKQWCKGGDWDTMRDAVSSINRKQLLVSLEPMSGNGKIQAQRFSVDELRNERTIPFTLENSSERYGLFICTSLKKPFGCRNKRALNHPEIDALSASGKRDQEIVFYFQEIVVHKGQMTTMHDMNFTEGYTKRLKKYFQDNDLPMKGFNQARKHHDKSRSLPLQGKDQEVIVEMRYNDPRCMGSPKESLGG